MLTYFKNKKSINLTGLALDEKISFGLQDYGIDYGVDYSMLCFLNFLSLNNRTFLAEQVHQELMLKTVRKLDKITENDQVFYKFLGHYKKLMKRKRVPLLDTSCLGHINLKDFDKQVITKRLAAVMVDDFILKYEKLSTTLMDDILVLEGIKSSREVDNNVMIFGYYEYEEVKKDYYMEKVMSSELENFVEIISLWSERLRMENHLRLRTSCNDNIFSSNTFNHRELNIKSLLPYDFDKTFFENILLNAINGVEYFNEMYSAKKKSILNNYEIYLSGLFIDFKNITSSFIPLKTNEKDCREKFFLNIHYLNQDVYLFTINKRNQLETDQETRERLLRLKSNIKIY